MDDQTYLAMTGPNEQTISSDGVSRCPFTGKKMRPWLTIPLDWRRPEDGRSWTIHWCDSAKYGHIFPRPDPHDIAAFYDVADYYTHDIDAVGPLDDASRQLGLLGRVLRSAAFRFEHGDEPTPEWWGSIIPQGAQSGLEIGCGNGDRMLTFAPYVSELVGIEPDPRAVEVARNKGLKVYEGVAEALPREVQGRKFDLIVFTHVLEHTLDPVLSMRNAAELLAEGGVLSCEVPNNECVGMRRMQQNWRWLDAPRHLNFFTMDSLRACAQKAGLRVTGEYYRGYVRQFLPDWMADEAMIRAKLERREVTRADLKRQMWYSYGLFLRTMMAHPTRKYDSIRIVCELS